LLKGAEFVRKVKALAKKRGTNCDFKAERGKGSHGTLYFGEDRAIIPNLKHELKSGTLHAILKQLGLNVNDLE
jgi:mRNA interferase HicA